MKLTEIVLGGGKTDAVLKVGDWIKFLHNGQVCLDEVEFIVKRHIFNDYKAITTRFGSIDLEQIHEIKRTSEFARITER